MLWQGVAKRDLDVRTRGTFRGPADAQMHATCYVEHLDYWRDDTSPLGANPDAYFPRPYSEYTGSNDKTLVILQIVISRMGPIYVLKMFR